MSGSLQADCARCYGLCCVVPAFWASVDFAIDKPAEQPCPHLQQDSRCGIHSELRPRGFRGCAVYDCFGAGQQVSQVTFGGRDWRTHPGTAQQMFAVFPVMRQLHELLWYLTAALALPAARPLGDGLRHALGVTGLMAQRPPDELARLDVDRHRDEVNALLVRASELARAAVPGPTADHRGADLIAARLVGADLRGANLRGARLVGARLDHADLRLADLTGADLRDADLRGADLTDCLFLTQPQLESAQGDAETALPAALSRPRHWSATPRRVARYVLSGALHRTTQPKTRHSTEQTGAVAGTRSAGILLFRHAGVGVEVLLGHMGGPFWAGRDKGGWSIPKGQYEPDEQPEAAARREFHEELGVPVPAGELIDLGHVRLSSGKVVTVWALESDFDPADVVPGTFDLEWPRGSGRIEQFPELDRAEWFVLDEARDRLVAGQQPFLDRLLAHLGG